MNSVPDHIVLTLNWHLIPCLAFTFIRIVQEQSRDGGDYRYPNIIMASRPNQD